jgi:hypothetical protein
MYTFSAKCLPLSAFCSPPRLLALHGKRNITENVYVDLPGPMLMTLIHYTLLPMMIIAKHSLQTDNTKHQCLALLSESTSLSQSDIIICASLGSLGVKTVKT